MNAGMLAQKAEVILQTRIILAALNQGAGFFIESLNADFELERSRRKPCDHFPQRLGQAVRHHLKMQEVSRLASFEKEFQDRFAAAHIQIEGPIHELELF